MTLPFPTTLDAFTDCQAQLMGESVGPVLNEALSAWVPIFNDCYEDGRRGDVVTLCGTVDTVDSKEGGQG